MLDFRFIQIAELYLIKSPVMTLTPVILITAGSAGLGATVARTFAQQGYHVVINYNSNSDRAEALIAELSSQTADANAGDQSAAKYIAIRADLDVQADIYRLVKETHDAMGRIDVLFSNGGWSRFRDTTSLDDNIFGEDWDRAFNMNVKSHLWLLHAAKPYLEEAEGSFITTSSIAGVRGTGSSLVRLISPHLPKRHGRLTLC